MGNNMTHFDTRRAFAMEQPSVRLFPGIDNAIILHYVWLA